MALEAAQQQRQQGGTWQHHREPPFQLQLPVLMPQEAGTAVPPQVISLGLFKLPPGSQWMFFFSSPLKSPESWQWCGQGVVW